MKLWRSAFLQTRSGAILSANICALLGFMFERSHRSGVINLGEVPRVGPSQIFSSAEKASMIYSGSSADGGDSESWHIFDTFLVLLTRQD